MSTDAEVREWARGQGREVSARGKLAADVRAEYEAAHPLTVQDDGTADLVIELPQSDSGSPNLSPDAPPTPSPRRQEIPPQGKKVRRWGKQATPRPGQKRPPRVSLESLASWAWGLGGMALQQAPKSTPVGRMLAIQAPVAGIIVDDMAKGTIVDRVLQPLARSSEKAEKGFALIGPPVLVAMISSKPELYPVLSGPLKVAMLSWVELAGPAMEKAAKRAEAMAEKVAGVDVDAMIAALFADVPLADMPSPDEEAAVRRARGGNG